MQVGLGARKPCARLILDSLIQFIIPNALLCVKQVHACVILHAYLPDVRHESIEFNEGTCSSGRDDSAGIVTRCARAETRFHLSAKRTSPFKSEGASVQSTTGSRGVRISGSNAG